MRHWDRLAVGDFAGHVAREVAVLAAGGLTPGHPAIPAQDLPQPYVLAYAPVARMNPFQHLLYSRARAHGAIVVPTVNREHLAMVPWPGPLVVHLHWIGDVVRQAQDDEDALGRVQAFADLLDGLRARRGAKIVWTAHNVLPHDTARPEADIAARRALLARCDAIHAMSPSTEADIADAFGAPDAPFFRAPHPSYEGVYPDMRDQAAARADLGIPADRFVFTCFGSLQRYKGVDVLAAAFGQVADRWLTTREGPQPHLLVAGVPTDAEVANALAGFAAGRTDVTLDARRVPTEEVATYMRAGDAAVAPYRRGLNSGVLQLARTFALPVIASDIGAFPEGASPISLVPPGDVGALAAAMTAMAARGADAARRSGTANGGADLTAPAAASDAFFDGLAATLGLSVPSPRPA